MFRSAPSAGRLAVAAIMMAPLHGQTHAPVNAPIPVQERQAADAALNAYVGEVLARHPGLIRASEALQVEEAKIPQAGSLEDPVLSLELSREPDMQLGVREDMRTRGLMVSQVLPWPGKRAQRETVARMEAKGSGAEQERVRLGLRADAKRAFISLLLAREQSALLDLQARLATQAEASVRARFETGQGSQGDLLRAQLELSRLQQRRWALDAELKGRLAGFNALRDRPAAEPFASNFPLEALPELDEAAWKELDEAAEARSPEVAAAEAHLVHAQAAIHENRLNLRPDFVVSGGMMQNVGVGTGWKVGLGLSLPIFAATKQRKAIAQWEAEHRMHLGERRVAVLNLARAQAERRAQAEGLKQTLQLYRGGLLVQSRAVLDAALLQLESGLGSYLAVLDAIQGLVSDRSALLESVAQYHAQAIAAEELNPGPTPPISGVGVTGIAMPAAGGRSAMAPGGASPRKEAGSAAPASSSMKSM